MAQHQSPHEQGIPRNYRTEDQAVLREFSQNLATLHRISPNSEQNKVLEKRTELLERGYEAIVALRSLFYMPDGIALYYFDTTSDFDKFLEEVKELSPDLPKIIPLAKNTDYNDVVIAVPRGRHTARSKPISEPLPDYPIPLPPRSKMDRDTALTVINSMIDSVNTIQNDPSETIDQISAESDASTIREICDQLGQAISGMSGKPRSGVDFISWQLALTDQYKLLSEAYSALTEGE